MEDNLVDMIRIVKTIIDENKERLPPYDYDRLIALLCVILDTLTIKGSK